MKRNRNQDWTDVLRERLQDARLPLEDKWGSSAAAAPGRAAGPAFADAPRAAWWPWALAGVAALVAAVLLLRPASAPEPDRLVQLQPDPTALPDTSSFADELPSFAEELPSFAGLPPTSFAGLTGESQSDGEEIPDRVGDDSVGLVGDDGEKKVRDNGEQGVGDDERKDVPAEKERHEPVRPLSELALADLPDEPTQPRRNRLGRVALRVQAGYEGASITGGTIAKGASTERFENAGSPNTDAPNTSTTEQYFYVPVLLVDQQPGIWRVIEFPSSPDPGLPNGSGGTGHTPEGQLVSEYVPGLRTIQKVPVAVPKAPVFPITFGVSASWSLSRSWTLSVGLDYAQRDGYRAEEIPIESQVRTNSSDWTRYRVYCESAQSLTLHYLGVPLDAHFYFNPESRWRFYVGAGLHAAKCIAVTGGTPLQDPVLFSGNVMAGTDFRLFPGVRIYLAPALSAPFNRSAYYNSWDTGLRFSLRAGLSFDL